ncbi:oligosaccharide flippase family protein [Bifidobacterium sp. 82T24]|uniref:murein biosynthesis integral membrane protein MurJ n=1 Tax=Bifidobacterium pluvialisilvae TaxID=2834436 RepID=UPI001C597690|nr:murein biosynthesis integral membrane protein MurJ [Bifidobacterium pluvialisilvae]MBW3088660.1 oligosaccharide flippase family protein [Bifidobacterium pluvialisilvae]
MSNSVGRNSLIMAIGTAASRVTGQIRSILLAAAIGTTGIAANAYQTGSMIPQVIFTLVSGGIFNAVLVPQIVRTLKHKDANERLSKLITVSIALLLGITAVMMLLTPVVTRLYVNPNWAPEQRALANAFTLWCMPQIFFYGLYLLLGQILAAKGRFATYAWSSVFANIISCAGFIMFIRLFGNAAMQPMDFWTTDKVMLTAGTWTLGVAFQALVLFIPLLRIGLKYRIRWGLHGIGLRSMGKVAVWSLALTVLNLVIGMVTSQINTGAPHAGHDLLGIAGNGSYQYAYSLYILPYSLIAVSITTAVFPKLSRAISDDDVDTARADLSSSLRSVGLMMMFFSAALIAMPVPIIRALLPSVNVHDALLIAGPLVGLSVGLVFISDFLLIQRTFYAYEDGKSPFMCALLNNAVQLAFLIPAIMLLPPRMWATLVGLSLSIAYIVTLPFIFLRLRKRMGGRLDGRRITVMHLKALVAAVVAGIVCRVLSNPLMAMLGVVVGPDDGRMSWVDSVIICMVLTVVIALVYALMLVVLRVTEFTDLMRTVTARLLHRGAAVSPAPAAETANATGVGTAVAGTHSDDALPAAHNPEHAASHVPEHARPHNAQTDGNARTGEATEVLEPLGEAADAADAASVTDSSAVSGRSTSSGTPAYRISTADIPARTIFAYEKSDTMKPGLGDTLIDRYTLVQSLREEPGLYVWRANDSAMAKDCQLFLITDAVVAKNANEIASSLALTHNPRFTPIQQLRSEEGSCLIVTDLDPGISLLRYIAHNSGKKDHSLSFEAIRTIVGETAEAAKSLREVGLNHRAIGTGVIRLTSQNVTLADAAISSALAAPLRGPKENPDSEAVTIRQLAGVLFEALTGHPYDPAAHVSPNVLPENVPEEFRILCTRGLGMHHPKGRKPVPISTLNEFEALLGTWTPMEQLTSKDIVIASHSSSQSAQLVDVAPTRQENLVQIPASFLTVSNKPELAQEPNNAWSTNQLLFAAHQGVDEVNPDEFAADYFGSQSGQVPLPGKDFSSKPTLGLDVSSIRHSSPTGRQNPVPAAGGVPGNPGPVPMPAGDGGRVPAPSIPPQMPPNDSGEKTIVMEPLPAGFEPQMPVNPPSYSPSGNVQSYVAQSDAAEAAQNPADARKQRMHRIVIIVVTAVVLAAVFAGAALGLGLFSPKDSKNDKTLWPSIDTSNVGGWPQGDTSSSPSASKTTQSPTATPTPSNTTAYETSEQTYISDNGQGGRGWYVRLASAQDVSRLEISIRQSGGKAAVYAGATSANPTGGTKVAEFSFAAGGTTEVKLSKTVKAQDLVIWVPTDTTPEGGLYFNSVQVY